jgi:hypothetical protein
MEKRNFTLKGTLLKPLIVIAAFAFSPAKGQNTAPYFVNPTLANNTTITAHVGDTVTFQVRGKDSQGQMVTLTSTALPSGASMTPALPTSSIMTNNGSKVNSKFMWVPTTVGTYSVTYTLTDNASTPLSASRTISFNILPQPCTLTVQTVVQNVGCFGGNNGSVTTTVTSPYSGTLTYAWNNNMTTANLTNVMAGSYTVTVTDSLGCVGTATAVVTQPQQLNVTGTATNFSCNATSNGVINITASGGTGPYTYSWSNNTTTQNQAGLQAGNYTVIVTDAHNCMDTATFTVGTAVPATLTVTGTATNFSCDSSNNGAININVAGGTGPYTYSWSNNATTQNLASLQPGNYSVTVTDAFGCTGTATFTVGAAVPMNLTNTFSVSPNISLPGQSPNTIYTTYGPQTVTITATPSVTTGLTYSWMTTTSTSVLGTSSSLTVTPTTTTSYIFTAMDSTGCIVIDTITINVMNVSCGSGGHKVYVCHHNKTLCLDTAAVAAHLAHGDMLGACTAPNTPNPHANAHATHPLRLAPNPTANEFTVAIPEFKGTAKLLVTDMSGRTIQTLDIREATENTKISLKGNVPGIYRVMLITPTATYSEKLIKQ